MAGRLEARVAIVTGAGSRGPGIGNGRAAAILFAREGASVLLMDQSRAAVEETLAMIEAEGGVAACCVGDVTLESDCKSAVAAAVARWGRLDILDNNVGIGGRGKVTETEDDLWRNVMEVNVMSMVHMSRQAIPAMAETGGGAIVNISSISAIRPRGLTPYTTSKGAVISLTMAMAVDHAAEGIRVNCVAPGPVFTPMVSSAGMSEELRKRRAQASLLGIEGTGWDIGNAVLFLASDEARYITGQTLYVDGGVSIVGPAR